MASKNDAPENRKINLPKASTLALRGKQSIRATFKLTEGCIDAINIVATHLGIKQKSLFDHLIEDAEALRSIARETQDQSPADKKVVAKTFVINRNSLDVLNKISEEYHVTKESLVEFSVQRLLPIIANAQVTHEERKKIIRQIKDHLKSGEKIHEFIKNQFGSDDIICKKYEEIMKNYRNCTEVIQNYIDKSRNIEKFEINSF